MLGLRERAYRQIPGLRQPDRARQPWRGPGAALFAVEARWGGHPRPNGRGLDRDAGPRRGRRPPRFGQTVGPQAVGIGIDKCKGMGLSLVALRNSGHIGRIGDWAEMAADAGLVSVHFVNASGSVLVAPFGGSE